jgi:hypothetical protein
MVAECTVSSPEGTETVRTFDGAWVRAHDLPRPTTISLVRFVRADRA